MPTRPTVRAVALLAAGLLSGACAGPQAAKQAWPAAGPASEARAFLWEVTRPDGVGRPLYLSGSVHVGKPGQFTFPPGFERVLGRVDALVLEVDPRRADPEVVKGLVMGLGTYRAPDDLDAHLDARTRELLPEALRRNHLLPKAVASLRPWFLATMLSMSELERAGYAPGAGVDRLLFERFQATGEILELESMERQLRMLAGLPEPTQVLLLRDVLEGSAETVRTVEAAAAAWQGGDAAAMAAILLERATDPDLAPLYETVFWARNRAMADVLAPLAGGRRTHLAVVGAGHVVGPKGLLALLEARGLRVRQLERE
ncbi:MAG: TraB/GumN family protein [Anaeromyxobacteraceae bacterium]